MERRTRRRQDLQDRETAVGAREEAQRVADGARETIAQHDREMRQANENLILATLEANQLNDAATVAHRRQDEFLAMLAHELRNLLAPIRSAAALLARLAPDAPVPPLIAQVIERQVAHMARLLDDLLDVSRVTSGKVRLQRRPIRVDEFIGHAVEACRSMISAQHQQLTLDLPELPIHVDGDPVRLEQVVSNLLHNAAKYTPEGGAIRVVARALGERVEIRVEDNGVGIAADVLPHIFDLFAQNERSLNRSQGGLGIGLTVARSMVELHGGSVEAFSGGPGLGSEFVVSLARLPEPVRSDDPPIAIAATAPLEPKPASVLLVDDNVDAAEMLAMLLQMSGHAVVIALDGPQALACFERERPQVVLCDIGLPEMDGYEVARRMRASGNGNGNGGMPLMVALTGYDGPTVRARALLAGFDRHLVKPVDPDEVLRLIDVFVQALPSA